MIFRDLDWNSVYEVKNLLLFKFLILVNVFKFKKNLKKWFVDVFLGVKKINK